jgi:hypothetical protein
MQRICLLSAAAVPVYHTRSMPLPGWAAPVQDRCTHAPQQVRHAVPPGVPQTATSPCQHDAHIKRIGFLLRINHRVCLRTASFPWKGPTVPQGACALSASQGRSPCSPVMASEHCAVCIGIRTACAYRRLATVGFSICMQHLPPTAACCEPVSVWGHRKVCLVSSRRATQQVPGVQDTEQQ